MPTREDIMQELDTIVVPGVMRSLVKMNLVRDISSTDGKVDIRLASAAVGLEAQEWLKEQIKKAAGKFSDVKEVNVNFVEGKPKDLNEVGHVIAIMSGKGGIQYGTSVLV